MKMWKKAASLALASALVVSLAACGSNGSDDSKEGSSSGSDVFMIGGIGPAESDLQQETMQFTVQPLKTESSLQLTRSMQTEESTDIRSSISLRMTRAIQRSLLMLTIL